MTVSLRTPIYFLLVFLLGISLYMPFRSRQYDLNGIAEAGAVEAGGAMLFSPNHMLYRPVGYGLYLLWQQAGSAGRSLEVLQILTAVCGALGLALAFLAYTGLTRRPLSALLGVALLGTSWAYWTFSTDIYYVTLAACCVAAALALFVQPRLTLRTVALMGVLCAAAVLTWQANVFLVPALALGLLWLRRELTLQARTTLCLVLVASSGLVTALVYGAVGVFAYGYQDPAGIFLWMFRYGAPLPMWGQLSPERPLLAAQSGVASLIPLWEGLGLRDLLAGSPQIEKLPLLLALLALLALLGWTALFSARPVLASHSALHWSLWLLSGYAMYLPFIVWWDPFEPKWFVVPNLFLVGALTLLWDNSQRYRPTVAAVAASIGVIAAANFSGTIWPRHTQASPYLAKAACVAGHLDGQDLLIATDWNWAGYVRYFYGKTTLSTLNLSTKSSTTEELMEQLDQAIRTTRDAGGVTYMVDPAGYSAEHLQWLAAQTGIDSAQLQRFELYPAFQCSQVLIARVNGLR